MNNFPRGCRWILGAGLSAATALVAADPSLTGPPVGSTAITPVDNYEQWKSALNTGAGAVPPAFTLMPGFEIETLRSAQSGEGSWVATAFDAKGHLLVAREKRGLLRFALSTGPMQVEVIDDTL